VRVASLDYFILLAKGETEYLYEYKTEQATGILEIKKKVVPMLN
jgi:hypothetical protein